MLQIRRNQVALITRLALTCLVLSVTAFGQYGTTTPDRGVKLGNSFSVGQFDTVNTTTGALMLNFPLASLPAGRGSATNGVSLTYNSKLYRMQSQSNPDQLHDLTRYDRTVIEPDPKGGWRLGAGTYSIEQETRWPGYRPDCTVDNWELNQQLVYQHKLKIVFPDGSTHEMIPYGHKDALNDRYFKVTMDGMLESCTGLPTYTTRPVYYSRDGSFLRLETSSSTSWTLYFADGSKVVNGDQIYDRNGNYVTGLTDQFQRSITFGTSNGYQTITSKGVGGEDVTWKIKWREIWVFKTYVACNSNHTHCHDDQTFYDYPRDWLPVSHLVVDEIVEPDQQGAGTYKFTYNASNTPTQTLTYGWGEVSSIELPSGAKVTYTYSLDNEDGPIMFESTKDILKNQVSSKTLTYDLEYDGQVGTGINGATETWLYSTGPVGSSVTAPDGSVTSTEFATTDPDSSGNLPWDTGLTYTSISPDGTKVENIWDRNIPTGCHGSSTCANSHADNPYIKTTFTSIKEGSAYTLTAIKDFTYDINGNATEVREYDYVPYSSVPRTNGRPTGLPSNANDYLKRVTKTEFHNQAPLAPTSSSTDFYDSNIYIFANPSRLLNLPKSVEVRATVSGAANSRSEMIYDCVDRTQCSNPKAGNVTMTRNWDSTKGSVSIPLTDSNSIKTQASYNDYGQLITTTDANNVVTQITYSNVTVGGNSVPGPYPTQTIVAHGTGLARTSTAVYDFHTGAVTSATDEDNDLTVVTVYDALGRPTIVKNAFGTPLESWTQTTYNDVDRYIVVKSDLEVREDGRKVAIQHFDPVGRVRLTRTLEDAANESPTNEQHGIKMQTRYQATGVTCPWDNAEGPPEICSAQLVSNPYRAGFSSGASSEETMGWTLTYSQNNGRRSEVRTFGGGGLPGPWGSNGDSTGIVRTDIDANRALVTDQAGKQRRSITNGLGQLIRVDEPNSTGALGDPSSPNQPTYYYYNTLGKTVRVNQGVQNRYFMHDSLGRLIRVRQPEQQVNAALNTTGNPDNNSWTMGASFDDNGNVLTSRDANNVVITSTYDALNRQLTRSYSDTTPVVTYTYDSSQVPYSKGKLTSVSSSISEMRFTAYDVAGRLVSSEQATDGEVYPSSYGYNLAGMLVEQTYPSGRVVKNTLDASGDISIIRSKKNANTGYWNYAQNIEYTPSGVIKHLRLGNGRWESAVMNSRNQVLQLRMGNSPTDASLMHLTYDYGEFDQNGNVDATKNAGNIVRQTINFSGLANAFVQTYKYDSLDRIAEAKEIVNGAQTWIQQFAYDRYGNRTSHSETVLGQAKAINETTLPSIDTYTNRFSNTTNYEFDAVGNLIRDAQGRQFTFNGDNKQTEVKDSQNNIVGEYLYDGNGKRIKKIMDTEYVVFVYDGLGKLIAEYSTDGPPPQPMVHYTATDPLGSPRVLTDENGQIISRRDFMPFGEELAADSTYRTSVLKYGVGDSVRQKFTGYERDEETGLDFAEARYYYNNHGRFTAVDPLLASGKSADPQTFNRYVYTMNRPLILKDSTGLQAGASQHELIHRTEPKQPQKDPVYQINYVETGRKDFKGERLSGKPAFGEIVVSRLEVTKDGKPLTADDIKKSGDDVRIKETVSIESDTIVKDGKTIDTPAAMKDATEDRKTDDALPLFNQDGKPLLDVQGIPAASEASAENNRKLNRTSVDKVTFTLIVNGKEVAERTIVSTKTIDTVDIKPVPKKEKEQ